MNRSRIFPYLIFILSLTGFTIGQDRGNQTSADNSLRGSGRVNASTLGMEFSLPIASYPGRGINLPIGISYSSKQWRMEYIGKQPIPGGNQSGCKTHYAPKFSEDAASGWTTSLAVPFIEYIGAKTIYNGDGTPLTQEDVECPSHTEPSGSYPFHYIRRILIHLPSGETHEMRPDDQVISFGNGSNDPYSPSQVGMWNATYYAVDSSNLKYVQDSASGTYRLLLPDGSYYDFDSGAGHLLDRKATMHTDRNGNYTTYNSSNGVWTDTLGRSIAAPFGQSAPAVGIYTYSLPGMTGTYKFNWKQLKGNTASTSGLTDFDSDLKFLGNSYQCTNGSGFPTYCTHPNGSYLFDGGEESRILSNELFNPIVLSEVELPTGQKYRFGYDVYGRIDKIWYPTGGEETFVYDVVPTLSVLDSSDYVGGQTNFGVTSRKVYLAPGDTSPYQWSYAAAYATQASGYKVTITNPDGTVVERYLHRGYDNGSGEGLFGYDNGLAGMAYEERSYSSSNELVSKSLTFWTRNQMSTTNGAGNALCDWHPRVIREDKYVYGVNGAGIYAASTIDYENESSLNQRDAPVLVKRTSQYKFVPTGDQLPSLPERITESTYLINDSAYSSVKTHYTAQNMVGLITSAVIKNGSGTVVNRNETVYDESGRSPGYRGNPTTSRVWDSIKGAVSNSNAYIETHANFDSYGNQYEATDALGNTSTTTFDSTHHAFPIQVTSAIPDPSGQYGSNQAFVSTTTFDYTTGLPTSTTDANGLETRITYDSATLRPISTKSYFNNSQVGTTTETIYHDEPGNYWIKNRSQIDEVHWTESIDYFDGLGRAYKSEQSHSGGNIFVEKEFDSEGRVKRVSNPFRIGETKAWTTNVYDEASRLVEVQLPDGAKVQTAYSVSTTSPVGVSKTVTDQAGKKRSGITDGLGNMVRVIEDPTGQNLVTDYVFDTLGNLRRTIQGDQSRYFMYDSLGRLLYAKQPEQSANSNFNATDPVTGNASWSARYQYNDSGNIVSTTDARNVSVTASYDSLGRIYLRDYSDATPDVNFYYDGKYKDAAETTQTATGSVKGKTTGITSSVSKTNFTSFDVFGRILTHEQITNGQTYSTAYQYNLSGALIEETYPSGRVVRNTIDDNGELSQVLSKKYANSGFWRYAGNITRDTVGNVLKMQLGNGRWETASFNNRLQVTQIGLGNTDSDQNLLKLEYGYATPSTTNNNGSMREQKITVPGAGGASGFTATQTYGYDDLNRLTVAEETIGGSTTWKQTFEIDRYGNRRFDASNTTTLGSCAQAICNPTISTVTNRISQSGYSFDANGNLTQDAEGRQFVYDAENHQKEVKDSLNNTVGQYLYDGEGRRVKKISSTETTVFVYNAGGTLVAEYSTELAETQQVSYLTQDHLGSPRVITNENGAVVSRRDFTAFGEESVTAQRTAGLGYDEPEIRKNYTGYEKDTESGLEFAQARYYNPTHGRFTSVDPLTASMNVRNPQTLNRYSYVLNSPYKYTDPLGLIPSSSNPGGSGCGAEFSNCDGPESESDRHFRQQYQTEVARMQANQAFARGDTEEGWRMIRESEGDLTALDRNGHVVEDPNQPTVTVEATVEPPSDGAAPVTVIIWDGVNEFTTSYFGHVSFVVYGDESLSWEGGYAYKRTTPASEYEKARSSTSAGVAYTLDFGTIKVGNTTVDLNQVFSNGLESFQDGKRGYGPVRNNCGHAFSFALERVRRYLNIPINTSTLPSGHKTYIETYLKKYITETRNIPKRE